jgi:hypothetical protein
MVGHNTFLQVRSLGRGGRSTNVARTQALYGRQSLGTDWIQDKTGRVTDTSRDDGNGQQEQHASTNSDNESITNAEQVPDANPNYPVITFSQMVPFYPIAYSCEHLFEMPQQKPPTSKRGDLFILPQAMDQPVLNSTDVPIIVYFFLPRTTIQDNTVAVDQVTKNVEAMEWSLLNLVVHTTGLSKNCRVNAQFDDRLRDFGSRARRRLLSTLQSLTQEGRVESLPYPTSIYKVASDRDNTHWEGKYGYKTGYARSTCSIISHTILFYVAARCDHLEYNGATSNCFTLQTSLNVKYRGTKEESNVVQEYVQNIIHKQIAKDPTHLFAMEVNGLHWAHKYTAVPNGSTDEVLLVDGNSTAPFETPKNEDNLTQATNTSHSNIQRGIASPEIYIPVATGIFVLVLWVIFHLFTRNKRRHNGKGAGIRQNSKEYAADIETGSVKTEPTISPTNSGPGSEFGTPDRKSLASPSPTRPRAKLSEAVGTKSLSKPVRRSAPVSVDSPNRKPLPVSVDSPARSAAGLPPRPPRRNSIKLKQNRKKRKKKSKKVVALKRVNSREHINEMPIISESDEDSELGSEDGSEYTSDDGSSYDASSGCITPSGSRSLSRTSSRGSSPQRSLADEDEDFDQNVEFFIVAPDFPNLLDGEYEINERDGDIGTATNGIDLEPRTRIRKSLSDDKLAQRLTKELNKLEIEPRSKDESIIEDGDSPKRSLPLPWLK